MNDHGYAEYIDANISIHRDRYRDPPPNPYEKNRAITPKNWKYYYL